MRGAVFFWESGRELMWRRMAGTGSKQIGQNNDKREKSRKRKTRTVEPEATRLPPIIPSPSLLSHTTSHQVLKTSLPQLGLKSVNPNFITLSLNLNLISFQPINTFTEPMMPPPTNATSATSCTVVGDDNDDNRVWIVAEAVWFDPHKPVITGIADCIRSKFELARPSWKKYPQSTRDMWFDEFKKKFRWLPHHTDAIRNFFEKRAAAKMCQ